MSILNFYNMSSSATDVMSEFTHKVDRVAFELLLNMSKQVELYTSPVIVLDDLSIELNLSEFKGQI